MLVGDPGAKGARPDDKVVFEMLRFPTADDRGEGVITECSGPAASPASTRSRSSGLRPARRVPGRRRSKRPGPRPRRSTRTTCDGREDFTGDTIVTIDPVDARDFDDAISLTRDEKTGHWQLGVHIADVGHFAAAGQRARPRGRDGAATASTCRSA